MAGDKEFRDVLVELRPGTRVEIHIDGKIVSALYPGAKRTEQKMSLPASAKIKTLALTPGTKSA